MKTVKIYKLDKDGKQELIVTCELKEGMPKVMTKGEDPLRDSIELEGIIDYFSDDNKKLYTTDGVKFLEQLKYNFKSGYLMATDVVNE